ncbi:putative hydrolase YxeP [Peribacillus sp. Bi96]|uniref:amidohydrolase n=1 Tax=unclassified Peribacillus TaxID=2675266 RepID=UPI001E0ED97E|nr:amidohydrolase [Peribacillus sp. Bi96]CAH0173042.1 putative hydrolase YxeP [Peribacillus sp. Bi96]
MNPIQYIEQHQELLIKSYLDLHSLAEPSWQEERTSDYIVKCLKKAGLTLKTFHSHYGIIAEIPGHSTKVVALRADMDALVQEVDGVVKANHSCGHDAHSTMVLYTALAIASSGMRPKHTLRFIFQPAEEKGEGALQMINDGVLENVTYLFGVHVRPSTEVPYMKASPVIVHGSAVTIRGTIKGIQAHASRPQDGINAIEAAALLVQKIQQLNLETEIPYSVKMTQIQTNNKASNVIPETAVFAIDARAQSNDVMNELNSLTKEAIDQTMVQTGTSISWSAEEFVPAATMHEKAIKLAEIAIGDIIGTENVVPVCVSQGGEDFHFYTAQNPDITATMIGLGCDLTPGLHHPDMKFNLQALIYGTKILINTVILAAEEENFSL